MTTTTLNQTALLNAAVTALVSAVAELKKAGVETIGLGSELTEGVKYRDLKNWLKDFKAKQKEVTPSVKETAPKTSGRKPKTEAAPKAETVGNVRDLELANSSNIESATYDRDAKVLRINFKNGSVYDYAGVAIREARNMEKAESAGKFFAENIKGQKEFTKVKAAASRTTASAPAAKASVKADAKPAAKAAPKAEAEAAPEYKNSELRGAEVLNGRKVETIAKVVAAKVGEGREVVTESGARYNVATLRKNNRGRFVVEAAAPAKTVKEAKASNRRANFEETKEAANNTRKAKPLPELPKIADVKGEEVRVIKGSKDKMVKIIRVVNREGVGRVAITEAKGVLPFGQIIYNDGVLTYTGKLTAEEYRAL